MLSLPFGEGPKSAKSARLSVLSYFTNITEYCVIELFLTHRGDKMVKDNLNIPRRSFVRAMGLGTGVLAAGGFARAASVSGSVSGVGAFSGKTQVDPSVALKML